MEDLKINTSETSAIFNPIGKEIYDDAIRALQNDYAQYLSERKIAYCNQPPYLLVGSPPMEEGWLFHIAIVRQQMDDLIGPLLDFLLEMNATFIIPSNADKHSIILDGRGGLMNVGKIISVCLNPNEEPMHFASNLLRLTNGFNAPCIPTAVKLGACLYVSFGKLFSLTDLYDNKFYSTVYGYNAENALYELLANRRIEWPFKELRVLKEKKNDRLIRSQYVPVQTLKNDPKGNVLKCIKLNRVYNMQSCVIKQGKKHQCFDDSGRDMRDRLLWQYESHKFLEGKVPLPKAIDYFKIDEDVYVTFEYIDGVPLTERVNELCQGVIWNAVPVDNKRKIIDYLLQITDIIDSFHQNGFIHRDTNPGNFLVTKDEQVIAVDIELCYNFSAEKQFQPFTLGTPGYMSPQQERIMNPTVEDDIYGLGALFAKAFTGLSPSKLNTEFPDTLFTQLQYLIGSNQLATLICRCLGHEHSIRPNVKSVRHQLELYDATLLTTHSKKTAPENSNRSGQEIRAIIQKAINSLSIDSMLGKNKEWISKTQVDDVLANELMNYNWYPGFHSGTAGTLYMLSLAEKRGYDITSELDTIYNNLNFLERQTDNFKALEGGLWHGSYGVAIALSAMIESELIENNINHINIIYELLLKPSKGLSVADGLAGQGLAILYYQALLQFPSLDNELHDIVSAIIKEQKQDGSWSLKKDETQSKGVQVTGFSYGIAGITYFLLEYYSRHQHHEVKTAIIQSLNWLTNQRKITNGNPLWPLNPQNQTFDPWLENGFTGIALTFIKAYEIIQYPIYKEIATTALMTHPKYISSNHFSMSNGLSGLGEVYLTAFKILKEVEWKERADHIVDFLSHAYQLNLKKTICWLEGNYTKPTADLMKGNSGIVHFLLNYLSCAKNLFNFL